VPSHAVQHHTDDRPCAPPGDTLRGQIPLQHAQTRETEHVCHCTPASCNTGRAARRAKRMCRCAPHPASAARAMEHEHQPWPCPVAHPCDKVHSHPSTHMHVLCASSPVSRSSRPHPHALRPSLHRGPRHASRAVQLVLIGAEGSTHGAAACTVNHRRRAWAPIRSRASCPRISICVVVAMGAHVHRRRLQAPVQHRRAARRGATSTRRAGCPRLSPAWPAAPASRRRRGVRRPPRPVRLRLRLPLRNPQRCPFFCR